MRRQAIRRFLAVVVLVAAGLVLAGCGGETEREPLPAGDGGLVEPAADPERFEPELDPAPEGEPFEPLDGS